MRCNICGTELESDLDACPGCGSEMTASEGEIRIPAPRGMVNDFPGILTAEEVKKLDELVTDFLRKTDVPIVIAVVETTFPLAPSEFAFILYNTWGIGQAKINMGLLMLLCLKEQWIESEVGLGLERYLPEVIGDEIVRESFVPYFRDKRYFEGLKAGTMDLITALRDRLPPVHRAEDSR
jgi:uncharacterized protein